MAERILLGTSEEWKTIPFAPNYEVSTFGQVRSWMIWGGGGNGKPLGYPRLLKLSLKKNGKGYLGVVLRTVDGPRDLRVNRLVALVFIPNPENKSEVNHKDLNRLNNYAGNLEWATYRENLQHAIEHGARAIGERQGCAKMTDEKVRDLRRRYPYGTTIAVMEKLAVEFQVHKSTIQRVVNNKNWKHVATT